MRRIEKFKILIVGLTTVLSLINFSNKDFKNEIVQNELNKNIEQLMSSDFQLKIKTIILITHAKRTEISTINAIDN